MKVSLDEDEWYPVITIDDPAEYGWTCDVPDELVARWRAVKTEFKAVQRELVAIIDAHGGLLTPKTYG